MGRRGWLTVLAVCLAAVVSVPGYWALTHPGVTSLGSLPFVAPTGSAAGHPSTGTAPPAPTPSAVPVAPATLDSQPWSPLRTPVELRIPALSVDAPVQTVGVRADGSVAIPPDARHVGWYRFGPAPGDPRGSAVIVGHRDSRTQGRGAVYDLSAVRLGDLVSVRLSDGAVLTYRVVERRLYLKQGLPWQRFFTTQGPPRLTIVTCGGSYLPDRGGYQDNLIVTAVPSG